MRWKRLKNYYIIIKYISKKSWAGFATLEKIELLLLKKLGWICRLLGVKCGGVLMGRRCIVASVVTVGDCVDSTCTEE